jgi:hypothetical protein
MVRLCAYSLEIAGGLVAVLNIGGIIRALISAKRARRYILFCVTL